MRRRESRRTPEMPADTESDSGAMTLVRCRVSGSYRVTAVRTRRDVLEGAWHYSSVPKLSKVLRARSRI